MTPPEHVEFITSSDKDRNNWRERQRQAAIDACEALAALPQLPLEAQRQLLAVDNVFVTMALMNHPTLHPVLQDEIAQTRHAFLLAESRYITQAAQNALIDSAFAGTDRGLCLRRLFENPACTRASRERIAAGIPLEKRPHSGVLQVIHRLEREGFYRDTPVQSAQHDEEYEVGE